MAQAGAQALLHGDVRARIVRLSLPSLAAMLASGLGTLLDALMLSRLGSGATDAAAVGFPLLTLYQTLGFTLGMGAGALMSQAIGRGEETLSAHAAALSLLLALALSAALSALGLLLPAPLLRLLGAGPESAAQAALYVRYLLLSAPLLCLSLVLSSLLRARGHAGAYGAAFAAGAALGAALEALLVLRLGWGLTGIGIAMIAREALTLLLLACCALRFRLPLARPAPRVLLQMLRYGLPTLLRQGLMSVSGVLLNREASALGGAALGGMGLAVRALSLVSSAVIGFGQGFQPVCGVCAGAGRMDRVREGFFFCLRAVVIALLMLGALLFPFAGALLSRFGAPPEAAAFGARVLRAQSVVLFAQGAVVLFNMLTQSLGLTVRAALVATSRQGFVLIPLLLLLPRRFGETGLILCQSVSDVLSLLLALALTRGILPRPEKADGTKTG